MLKSRIMMVFSPHDNGSQMFVDRNFVVGSEFKHGPAGRKTGSGGESGL